MIQAAHNLQFLSGGGEMGKLTREKDWSNNILGNPETWPQNLKIALGILLNSKFPMFLWWGKNLVCFYNDAYRPSLGKEGKHPSILGMNAKDAWEEIWHIIKPLIDKVIEKREAVWFEDLLVPIYRNGRLEDVYWTFSYSPVNDDNGETGGVLVTCTETTEKVIIKKQLEESERKLKLIIYQAPVAIGIFRGENFITEIANSKALELWGRTAEEVLNKPILDAMPELRSQGIEDLLNDVYKNGNTFSADQLPIQIKKKDKLETAYVNFSFEPLYNTLGIIDGIMTVGIDVSPQTLATKAIEANEEKLNIVIEASELGTWELDMQTRNVSYSKRYLEVFGYTDYIELSHTELVKHLHPDDLVIREQAFKDAIKTGYLHYKSRLIWNDGSIHWFEGRGKLFYDQENKPLKLIGTIRDISAEKKYQRQLEQSEQRFRDLIMTSPIPKAILKGKDHVVEMANEVLLEKIWRKTESEVLGKKILDVFPELQEQKYPRLLDEVYATGKKWAEHESLISLAGNDGIKKFYVDFEFAPLVEADNNISGIKLTAVDVTEKVEARIKIEESEQKFRLLADSMPQHVWVADTSGEIYYFNQFVFDYSGLTLDQVKKDGWLQMVHPEDREENIKAWMHSITTGKDFLFEHRFRRYDGEYRWQLSRAIPQKDMYGNIQMWVGTSTDIQNIKDIDSQKDYFIGMASHELKTPLTSIKGYVQMLQNINLTNNEALLKKSLNTIDKQVVVLTNLISDMLDISKIKSGHLSFNKENFEMTDLIYEIINEVNHIHPKHSTVLIKADKAHVFADRNRIGQVLINLLSNAVKYSPDSKEIHVSSIIQDGNVTVSVKDFGIGISQNDQRKIFERYYRVEGKNEKRFPGFGIGLFIAQDIIAKHDGKIAVESNLGKGSIFYFSLPLVENAKEVTEPFV
jgi:PAS domain S-box-containing protein